MKIKFTKNKKIVFVILLALCFAIAAGWGTYQILTPQRTTVYVFNGDYAAGTQVTKSMLTAVEVDRNLVVNSYTVSTGDYLVTEQDLDAVLNTAGVLRSDVRAGNIFVSAILSTTGGNRVEMAMRPDSVAVTIGANNITSVTPELAQGSRVNVYANYNETTFLILQSQRVLSVVYESGHVTGVTLECTVDDSLRLIHAYTYGSIHLGMVDASGYQHSADNAGYNVNGFTQTP